MLIDWLFNSRYVLHSIIMSVVICALIKIKQLIVLELYLVLML